MHPLTIEINSQNIKTRYKRVKELQKKNLYFSCCKNITKEKDIDIETHPDCDFLFVFHIVFTMENPFNFKL